MVNKKYIKGANFERQICKFARDNGHMAVRSAGSKSKVDAIIINTKERRIYFLQAKKTKKKTSKEKYKSVDSLLFDEFMCSFHYITDIKQIKTLLGLP